MSQDHHNQGGKKAGLFASKWADPTQQATTIEPGKHTAQVAQTKAAEPSSPPDGQSEALSNNNQSDQREPKQQAKGKARAPSPQAVAGSPIEDESAFIGDTEAIDYALEPEVDDDDNETRPNYVDGRYIRYASGELVRRDARRLSSSRRSRSRGRSTARLNEDGSGEQPLSRRRTGFSPEQADEIAELASGRRRGGRREERDDEDEDEDQSEEDVLDDSPADPSIEAAVEQARSSEAAVAGTNAQPLVKVPTRSAAWSDCTINEQSSEPWFGSEDGDKQRDSQTSLFHSFPSPVSVKLPPPGSDAPSTRRSSEDSTTGLSDQEAQELIDAWQDSLQRSGADFARGADASATLRNKKVDFVMQQEDDFYKPKPDERRAPEAFIRETKDSPAYRERLELRLHEHKIDAITARTRLDAAEQELSAACQEVGYLRSESDGLSERVKALRDTNAALKYQVAAERERADRDSQIALLARRRAKGELHFWQHYVDSGTQTAPEDGVLQSGGGEAHALDADDIEEMYSWNRWSKIECDTQSEPPYPNPHPDPGEELRGQRRESAPARLRLDMVRLVWGEDAEDDEDDEDGDDDQGRDRGSGDGRSDASDQNDSDSDDSHDGPPDDNSGSKHEEHSLHPADLLPADYERWPTHLRGHIAAEIIKTVTGEDVADSVENSDRNPLHDLIVYELLHSGKTTFASLCAKLMSEGFRFEPITLARNLVKKGLTVNPEVLYVSGGYHDPSKTKLGSLLEKILWLKQDLVQAYKENDQWSYDNGLPVRLMHFSNKNKDSNDNQARLHEVIKELKQDLSKAEKEVEKSRSLKVQHWVDSQEATLALQFAQEEVARLKAQLETSHASRTTTITTQSQGQRVNTSQSAQPNLQRDAALKDLVARAEWFHATFGIQLSEYDPDMFRFLKGDSDAAKQVQDLSEKLQQSQVHGEELQAERDNLTTQLHDLTTKIDSLELEKSVLEAKATEEDEARKQERETHTSQMDKLEQANADLHSRVKELKAHLGVSQVQLNKAHDQLAVALTERKTLKGKNTALKREVHILELRVAAAGSLASPSSPSSPGFEDAGSIIASLQDGLDRHHRSAREAEEFLHDIRSGRREPSPPPPPPPPSPWRVHQQQCKSAEKAREERDWERVKRIIALGRDEGTREIWKFLQEKEARGEPPI